MKVVYLIKHENKNKAELLLKGDDLVNRGSITIKEPSSIDMKEDGVFFILDASEAALKRAEELLKGLGEKYKHKEKVIKAVEEQENTAISGFGNILG
jgi:hypothetical protein